MKLSTNMIVQVLGTFAQSINVIFDILPAKYKPVAAAIIGCIQLWVALLGHNSNPDGTAASAPYIKKVILLCLLIPSMCICSINAAVAQTTEQGIAVGGAFDQGSTDHFKAWGTYDHQLSAGLFSYNGIDGVPYKEGTQYKIRIQAFTGIAQLLHQFGPLSLWASVAGGIATNGDTTTGLGKYSGFLNYELGKGFSAILAGEGTYSPLAGSDGLFRAGIRYGLKKNP